MWRKSVPLASTRVAIVDGPKSRVSTAIGATSSIVVMRAPASARQLVTRKSNRPDQLPTCLR